MTTTARGLKPLVPPAPVPPAVDGQPANDPPPPRDATPEDFGILKPVRFLTDAEGEALDRAKREELVRATLEEIPRSQAKWRMAPEFARVVTQWDGSAGLVLLGPTGSGKTSAAARIIERLCELGVEHGGRTLNWAQSVCWTDAGVLGRAGGADDEASRTLLRRAAHARLLVLDDVARPNDTVQLTLRLRLKHKFPTLVTSGARNEAEVRVALGGDAVLRHILDATGKLGRIVITKTVPKP